MYKILKKRRKKIKWYLSVDHTVKVVLLIKLASAVKERAGGAQQQYFLPQRFVYVPPLKPLRCSIKTSFITSEALHSGNVWTQQKERPLLTESLSQSDLRSASLLIYSENRTGAPHHCSAKTNVQCGHCGPAEFSLFQN